MLSFDIAKVTNSVKSLEILNFIMNNENNEMNKLVLIIAFAHKLISIGILSMPIYKIAATASVIKLFHVNGCNLYIFLI